jgi:hypothetical protein
VQQRIVGIHAKIGGQTFYLCGSLGHAGPSGYTDEATRRKANASFLKKDAKNLLLLSRDARSSAHQNGKSFLVFFQKSILFVIFTTNLGSIQ